VPTKQHLVSPALSLTRRRLANVERPSDRGTSQRRGHRLVAEEKKRHCCQDQHTDGPVRPG